LGPVRCAEAVGRQVVRKDSLVSRPIFQVAGISQVDPLAALLEVTWDTTLYGMRVVQRY
jgi:hypothetical protein